MKFKICLLFHSLQEESFRNVQYFATSKVLKRLSITYIEISKTLKSEGDEKEDDHATNKNDIDTNKDLLDIDRKLINLVRSAITKSKDFKTNLTQIPSSILELAANKLSLTAEAFGHVSIDSEGNITWIVSF